jgi:hypothetical protein
MHQEPPEVAAACPLLVLVVGAVPELRPVLLLVLLLLLLFLLLAVLSLVPLSLTVLLVF